MKKEMLYCRVQWKTWTNHTRIPNYFKVQKNETKVQFRSAHSETIIQWSIIFIMKKKSVYPRSVTVKHMGLRKFIPAFQWIHTINRDLGKTVDKDILTMCNKSMVLILITSDFYLGASKFRVRPQLTMKLAPCSSHSSHVSHSTIDALENCVSLAIPSEHRKRFLRTYWTYLMEVYMNLVRVRGSKYMTASLFSANTLFRKLGTRRLPLCVILRLFCCELACVSFK